MAKLRAHGWSLFSAQVLLEVRKKGNFEAPCLGWFSDVRRWEDAGEASFFQNQVHGNAGSPMSSEEQQETCIANRPCFSWIIVRAPLNLGFYLGGEIDRCGDELRRWPSYIPGRAQHLWSIYRLMGSGVLKISPPRVKRRSKSALCSVQQTGKSPRSSIRVPAFYSVLGSIWLNLQVSRWGRANIQCDTRLTSN